VLAESKKIDSFLEALVTDIKRQIEYFGVKELLTVYIGGGTPSVLGEKINIIFDALKSFSPQEFTVEANPESLTEEFLLACKNGGVNRLSLGVQSFCEASRVAVGRIGEEFSRRRRGAENAEEEGRGVLEGGLELAARFFPGGLSVDLIAGLPFQDEKVLLDDIRRVLEFKPAHVSLYSLSVESGTVLEEKIKNRSVVLPDADTADAIWLAGRDALLKAGFEHYEVSNFALPGKRCIHNMRYWQMLGWMGAGPAASGTIIDEVTGTAIRYTYPCDVDGYIWAVNSEQLTKSNEQLGSLLNKNEFLKECMLMGFRCIDGPDTQLFKRRFGFTAEECIPKTLALWKGRDKMLFLNQFLADAFEEAEMYA